jgi:ribose transport system substrate-binding protein
MNKIVNQDEFMSFEKSHFESNPPGILISANSNVAYKIYLITIDRTSPLSNSIHHGVSDMSKLTGIDYIWDAPAQIDVDAQIQTLRNAIQNGANAIMLEVVDPVLECRAIEGAKALGVKIIYVNAPANEEGIITLATDNYQSGERAGQSMLYELRARGIKSGSIGIIAVNQTTPTTMAREKGFRSVMNTDGRFQILSSKYTNDNVVLSQWSAHSQILMYPDLVGLLGLSAATTLGVGRAIKISEKSLIGIGFETNKAIQALINHSYLQAVLLENPYTMGYLGMAETIAALSHFQTGPDFLDTGTSIKSNY